LNECIHKEKRVAGIHMMHVAIAT